MKPRRSRAAPRPAASGTGSTRRQDSGTWRRTCGRMRRPRGVPGRGGHPQRGDGDRGGEPATRAQRVAEPRPGRRRSAIPPARAPSAKASAPAAPAVRRGAARSRPGPASRPSTSRRATTRRSSAGDAAPRGGERGRGGGRRTVPRPPIVCRSARDLRLVEHHAEHLPSAGSSTPQRPVAVDPAAWGPRSSRRACARAPCSTVPGAVDLLVDAVALAARASTPWAATPSAAPRPPASGSARAGLVERVALAIDRPAEVVHPVPVGGPQREAPAVDPRQPGRVRARVRRVDVAAEVVRLGLAGPDERPDGRAPRDRRRAPPPRREEAPPRGSAVAPPSGGGSAAKRRGPNLGGGVDRALGPHDAVSVDRRRRRAAGHAGGEPRRRVALLVDVGSSHAPVPAGPATPAAARAHRPQPEAVNTAARTTAPARPGGTRRASAIARPSSRDLQRARGGPAPARGAPTSRTLPSPPSRAPGPRPAARRRSPPRRRTWAPDAPARGRPAPATAHATAPAPPLAHATAPTTPPRVPRHPHGAPARPTQAPRPARARRRRSSTAAAAAAAASQRPRRPTPSRPRRAPPMRGQPPARKARRSPARRRDASRLRHLHGGGGEQPAAAATRLREHEDHRRGTATAPLRRG